jgi:hypothetical protein
MEKLIGHFKVTSTDLYNSIEPSVSFHLPPKVESKRGELCAVDDDDCSAYC